MNEYKTFKEITVGDRLFLINRILCISEIYEVKEIICQKSLIIFETLPIIAQKNMRFWISWHDVDDYTHYYCYQSINNTIVVTSILTSDENHFLKLLEEL